jgi:hypothetical protein
MNEKIKILIGTSGIGSIELINHTLPNEETIKVICQAIIAIATVIALFKKKKENQKQ